jgi:hypothetical protein
LHDPRLDVGVGYDVRDDLAPQKVDDDVVAVRGGVVQCVVSAARVADVACCVGSAARGVVQRLAVSVGADHPVGAQ